MKIKWEMSFDENDMPMWEASSPYALEEDCCALQWRLKQRRVLNRVQWFEAHDAELLGDTIQTWSKLREAKQAIEQAHREIVNSPEFQEEAKQL